MTKSQVVGELDMYISQLKPAIEKVQTFFGAYKKTAAFWRRYVHERTHNQQLKDIADGGLKSVEQLKYFAGWLQYHLNNLEKLKKELGK
jgi:uncharacterized protein YeaO (DUF488 family)